MNPALADVDGAEVEVVASIAGLESLAAAWRDLAARDPSATPFQWPEWTIPWYRVFGPDGVHVVAVRNDGGRLLALLPALRAGSQLVLAGADVSDYRSMLVDPAHAARAIQAIDAALERNGWTCVFDDVPPDAAWPRMLDGDPPWRVEPACVCPYVPLPSTVDEWRAQLPAGLGRNIRRYGRRLHDDAGVRYATITGAPQVGASLASLFRLHSRRWHGRGEPGVLQSADVRRFHEISAPALSTAGLLRLHLLYAGPDVVAAQYVLVGARRAYSYIGGFDPEWARYGPGALLMAHSIAHAIVEGCVEFDLLRGVEPYKYTWGAVNRSTIRLVRTGTNGR